MAREDLLIYDVVKDKPYRQIDVEPSKYSFLLEDKPDSEYQKKENTHLTGQISSKTETKGSGYKISGTLLILSGFLSPVLVFKLDFAPVFLFIPILLTAFGAGMFYKGELKNKIAKSKKTDNQGLV